MMIKSLTGAMQILLEQEENEGVEVGLEVTGEVMVDGLDVFTMKQVYPVEKELSKEEIERYKTIISSIQEKIGEPKYNFYF